MMSHLPSRSSTLLVGLMGLLLGASCLLDQGPTSGAQPSDVGVSADPIVTLLGPPCEECLDRLVLCLDYAQSDEEQRECIVAFRQCRIDICP